MSALARRIVAMAALACAAAGAWADHEVRVDLKNVSGEAKANWPVVLRVYTVLGRNLPPGSVNPEGFHVYDPAGQELPHTIERVPPDSQPGNDEIVFLIPKIEPGEVLSYRITNNAAKPGKRTQIDAVNGPHNLISDGGFERLGMKGSTDLPPCFTGPVRADGQVVHSGKTSMLLHADSATISTKYAKPIPLHKGSWYYFGAWSKTQNVARFGYQARGGCYVQLTARDPKDNKAVAAFRGQVTPQCSTRDWLRLTLEGEATEWGMDRYVALAEHPEATLELQLRQPKHYYMDEGQTSGSWWLDDLVLMEQPEVNVRFDLAIEPLTKDEAFLFTRPPHTYLGNLKDQERPGGQEWCSYPYPHEKLTRLDKFALKGQRATFCVGVYHTREIADVVVRVAGGALADAQGRKLPVELVEFLPGFVGDGAGRYMRVLCEGGDAPPVTLAGEKGVRYFFLTFHVPPDAKAGRYTGQVEVLFEKDKLRQSVPVTLRVQDMAQPAPADTFVGIIFQGGDPPFNDEGLKVYSRSGFTCLTRFGGFLSYERDAAGNWQVDLAKLNERMTSLKSYGVTGVSVFSDFDLGPRWNGGELLKRTRPKDFNEGKRLWGERLKTAEEAWKAQIRRIEEARKQHPEWPTLIYMTFDEPNLGGGVNGKPEPAMGWLNEVATDAWTTLDCQFDPLPVCLKWYTVPAFDDPADWAGPEVYRWVRKQGKRFGFCGSAREEGDSARYQAGMLMAATGARYFHAWHLSRPEKMPQNIALDKASGRVLRAVSMINWAAGMDDLKAHHLLRAAMAEAQKSSDPARRNALKAAEDYLAGVFAIFSGDHKPTWPNEPCLGTTTDWGCEGFYDQWQEQMARHAAALMGVTWID